MRPLFLFLLPLIGCDTAIPIDDAETPGVEATEDRDDDRADDPQDAVETPTCADFLTPPHNLCDGHGDFELTVVDVIDADGDGLWAEAETLTVRVELYSAVEHMAYPGVLAGGSEGVVPDAPEWWWYGIFADTSYEVDLTFVRDRAVGSSAEIVLTVGALNCAGNLQFGNACPQPGPVVLEVPLAP